MGTGGSRVTANAGPAVASTAREVRERAAAGRGRAARVRARRRPHRGEPRLRRRHARTAPCRSGRLAQAAVRSKAPEGHRRARAARLHLLLSRHRHVGLRHPGRRGRGGSRDRRRSRLLGYAVVHDPGRAINPMIVEAQLQGGAVQGIGAGLMEERRLRRGRPAPHRQPHGLRASRGRRAPAARRGAHEHRSAINSLGIKGVGESGAIPGAAAIANAVEDAVADLGVTVREVPVTSARLFALLEAARARRGLTGPRRRAGRAGVTRRRS